MAKILVVEDDPNLGLALLATLENEKHVVELVADGKEGLDRLSIYPYELVVLDWQLPGMEGVEICRNYRKKGGQAKVIMLTAKDQIFDKQAGFAAGVDDYLTKPFDMRELTMRVVALLRRPAELQQEDLMVRDITLNFRTRSAQRSGKEITLTAMEFAVLEYFMRRPNQFFSVKHLLNEIWSSESDSSEFAVRQCISRLRKKLGDTDEAPIICTSKGLGYKLEV